VDAAAQFHFGKVSEEEAERKLEQNVSFTSGDGCRSPQTAERREDAE
jgi:hypothetical protein